MWLVRQFVSMLFIGRQESRQVQIQQFPEIHFCGPNITWINSDKVLWTKNERSRWRWRIMLTLSVIKLEQNKAIDENRTHPWATGSHLPYRITQCYLPPDTSERTRLNPSSKLVLDLPTPEGGRLSWPRLPGNAPTGSQTFGHKSDALTTTLPSLTSVMYGVNMLLLHMLLQRVAHVVAAVQWVCGCVWFVWVQTVHNSLCRPSRPGSCWKSMEGNHW